MVKKFCDRCGKQIKDINDIRIIGNSICCEYKEYILCDKCITVIKRIIKYGDRRKNK